MKSDIPGFLDIKLSVIAVDVAAWREGLVTLGTVEAEHEVEGWRFCIVRTPVVIRSLTIRIWAYLGQRAANLELGLLGADRLLADGRLQLPDEATTGCPHIVGPPTRETWVTALRAVLRDAAAAT